MCNEHVQLLCHVARSRVSPDWRLEEVLCYQLVEPIAPVGCFSSQGTVPLALFDRILKYLPLGMITLA